MLRPDLVLVVASFSLTCCLAHGQAPIYDPLAEELPSDGVGMTLVPFAQIPNSPSFGTSNDPRDPFRRIVAAPRLNMLKEAPDGSGRLLVNDQHGYLYSISRQGSVTRYLSVWDTAGTNYIYLGGQTGFTSFAFHPEFAKNGKFYTVYSVALSSGTPDFPAKRPIDGAGTPMEPEMHDVLVEWTASNPAASLFSGTRRELLRIEQPYDDHNTGEVAFNPNADPGDSDYGMLYLAVADGGNVVPILDADPENNGQDLSTILGTIIRIDPLGTSGRNGKFGIPSDNPFAATGGGVLPEIWSYGHRNPHRISWDTAGDRAMYAFEIGQSMIEEVNRIVPGGNYGWGNREGSFLLVETNEDQLWPIPADEPEGQYIYPVLQYDHPPGSSDGSAITGGFVYRGSRIPSLYGKVIFADFTSRGDAYYANISEIQALGHAQSAPIHLLDVYDSNGQLASLSKVQVNAFDARTDARIGSDLNGEVYFMNKRNGRIHKMESAPVAVLWRNIFPDAVDLGGGFINSAKLGGMIYVNHWPWVQSDSLGWVYILDSFPSEAGLWIYLAR